MQMTRETFLDLAARGAGAAAYSVFDFVEPVEAQQVGDVLKSHEVRKVHEFITIRISIGCRVR